MAKSKLKAEEAPVVEEMAIPVNEEPALVVEEQVPPTAEEVAPVPVSTEGATITVSRSEFYKLAYGLVTKGGLLQFTGHGALLTIGRIVKPGATYDECLAIWDEIKANRS